MSGEQPIEEFEVNPPPHVLGQCKYRLGSFEEFPVFCSRKAAHDDGYCTQHHVMLERRKADIAWCEAQTDRELRKLLDGTS